MNQRDEEEEAGAHPERKVMENKNNRTIIPLQLPKELQEELMQLRNQLFPDKTEEEWYAFVVQAGLTVVKSNEKNQKEV